MKIQRALKSVGWALASCLAVRAASAQVITEFRVPSGGMPLHIAPGPGGMWFTEAESRIGLIAADGSVSEFPVRAAAHRIVAGRDGNLWFISDDFVSKMTTSGSVSDFPLRGRGLGIAVGPDQNIWFTEIERPQAIPPLSHGLLGRVTPAGEITEMRIGPWAESLASGPDGNFWLPDWTDTSNDAIVRVTTSGVETRFALPGGLRAPGDVGPAEIASAADGNLWFTLVRTAEIGRITPSGAITIFEAPGWRGLAPASDGSVWFTEQKNNRLGRITTGGSYTEIEIPTPNAGAQGIAAGADGNIWFTETGSRQIGRINLSASTAGSSLALSGGRFLVAVGFLTPAGAAGAGHPVSLTSETGYFWFFDPDNVEVVVKVVDGCSFNSRRWLYVAGLTNVNVLVTVTDTRTGQTKQYVNPQGVAFQPIQDTDSFPGCL